MLEMALESLVENEKGKLQERESALQSVQVEVLQMERTKVKQSFQLEAQPNLDLVVEGYGGLAYSPDLVAVVVGGGALAYLLVQVVVVDTMVVKMVADEILQVVTCNLNVEEEHDAQLEL